MEQYTIHEVSELRRAISKASYELHSRNCLENRGCDECPVRHVCEDLADFYTHLRKIERLINQTGGSTNE